MSLFRRFNFQSIVLAVALGLVLTSYSPLPAGSEPGHKGSGWLGISIQDISEEIMEATGLKTDQGVLVNEVFDDTPAEKGGLKAGDVLKKFNDEKIEEVGQFVGLVRESKPGDSVKLTVSRDDQEMEMDVEIGERPEEHHLEMSREGWPDIHEHKGFKPFSHSFQFPSGGYIGVKIQDLNSQLAEAFGLKKVAGALVLEAEEDGPAFEAGIRGGDIIVKVGDDEIDDTGSLKSAIREKDEGDEVEITVLRNKKKKSFKVTIGESPGFSSIEKHLGMIDLGDELEGLKDIRIEIQTDIKEEMAKLKEEMKELKDELKELKKDN
jgi:C-terminal processing protease CtpA/Prc